MVNEDRWEARGGERGEEKRKKPSTICLRKQCITITSWLLVACCSEKLNFYY